jgi:hypothetical protein
MPSMIGQVNALTARWAAKCSGESAVFAGAGVFGLVTDASRGHFPGISSVALAVQQARQDAVATFTAKGFEAAAVTIIAPMPGSAFMPSAKVTMVHVTFDRPLVSWPPTARPDWFWSRAG